MYIPKKLKTDVRMPKIEKTYTVYKWSNRMNGRCYVGMTDKPSRRTWQHKNGHSPDCLLFKAIQKHGIEAFDYEELATNLTESRAFELEEHYIDEFNAYTNGYNRTTGGRIARPGYGEEHHNSKHTEEIIMAVIMDSCSESKAAKKYGVTRGNVYQIRKGIIWPHLDRSKAPQYENDKNKLTEENARDIFLDSRTQQAIAAEYGINPSSVSNIKRRKSWKDATRDLIRPTTIRTKKRKKSALEIHTNKYKIFRIVNTLDNKAFIGIAVDPFKRMSNLFAGYGSKLIRDDVSRLGKGVFIRQVLDSAPTKEEANRKRHTLIVRHSTLYPFGYNLTIGGRGSRGAVWSGESRNKINGSKNSRAKLTESQVVEILRDPGKRNDIAKKYGVSPATITGIKNRTKWKHVPLPADYVPFSRSRGSSA
jgi:group I intron endonuclease